MNNRQKRFFNVAREVSRLSDYQKVHIGAVVVEGNRIISTGFNSNKTSTTQYKYNRYRFDGAEQHPAKTHAEIAALAPLINRRDIDWAHTSIYVYREQKDGKITCARPCKACSKLIKDLGIKNVFYSDWDGNFVREEFI
jgi:deoxycytidylate deaminase